MVVLTKGSVKPASQRLPYPSQTMQAGPTLQSSGPPQPYCPYPLHPPTLYRRKTKGPPRLLPSGSVPGPIYGVRLAKIDYFTVHD